MSKPIQPTPTLHGEDARRVLEDLKNHCSPEEAKRRSRNARRGLLQHETTESLRERLLEITDELIRRNE